MNITEIREKINNLRYELGCSFWDYQFDSDSSDLARKVLELMELLEHLCNVLERTEK